MAKKENDSTAQKALQKRLKKTIKKMQKIQKAIAADDQPVSMHELASLSKLGEAYAKIIAKMAADKQ